MADAALAVEDDTVSADVAHLADSFVDLMRTFMRARNRVLSAAADDVEWSARVILKHLHTDGPKRAGSLADDLRSDPSTVSRQVAALVKDGLLERRADPEDGRASLLELTPRAHEVVADYDRSRLEFFQRMLGDWDPEDLQTFSRLLVRFTDDFNTMNHDWARPSASPAHPEETDR